VFHGGNSLRRPGRWTLLLLLIVGCACSRGGGCADSKRHVGEGGLVAPVNSGVAAASSQAVRPSKEGRPPRRPAAAEGTVVRVRDGDSIVVMRGGVGVEVRLDGIDCPELAQAFGGKAKSFTSGLAFGKTVGFEGQGKDRYGRELGEVFLPDGKSLNRELVSAGYAWWYRKYSTDRSLEALERTARKERRGLWAVPNPVPPWEFRADGRN
jgi:endonuclease YncB( thermonuclease family)